MKQKLVAAAIASILALGAAQAGAHGGHHDKHHGKHAIQAQYERYEKQAKYHQREARQHYKKAIRAERKADRAARLKAERRAERYASHYECDRYGSNVARVVSVKPVYRSYSRPVSDHSCLREQGYRGASVNYTGPILGAVIGGALGHRIGDAHGDPQVAAVAGGLLGASIGHTIGRNVAYNRSVTVDGPCRVREHNEQVRELVEYRVGYRYNGEVHYASMDYDPGQWVKLDVNVTPA